MNYNIDTERLIEEVRCRRCLWDPADQLHKNKKLKSDRINDLRKQYDAFLEDDKKRKERNEYILGRLDKMRYSTALVPVRYKPIPLLSSPSPTYYQGSIPEYSSVVSASRRVPSYDPIPLKKSDDGFIQEISKKYILIPKLRSFDEFPESITHQNSQLQIKDPIQNINVTSAPNQNSDWKSKYEILNILKKEENDKPPVETNLLGRNTHNKPSLNSDYAEQDANVTDTNMKLNIHDESTDIYKYLDEKPEKDRTQNYNQLENESFGYVDNNQTHLQNSFDNSKNDINIGDSPIGTIDYQLNNMTLEEPNINTAEKLIKPEEVAEIAPENITEEYADQSIQNQNVSDNYEGDVPINQIESSDYNQSNILKDELAGPMNNSYINEVDNTQFDTQASNEIVQDISSNEPTKDTRDYDGLEHSDQINIQALAQNQDQIEQEISREPAGYIREENNSQYKLDHHGEINEENPVEVDKIEHLPEKEQEYKEDPVEIVNESDIQEFQAEQEMFYPEQSGETYQQDHPNTYNQDYTQENQDYTQENQDYTQENQVYQENQDYAYYEGAQTEQFYEQSQGGVNENEDLTQRYDPQYEQQYGAMNVDSVPTDQTTTQPDGYDTVEPITGNYQETPENLATYEGIYENQELTSEIPENYDGAPTVVPEGYDQMQPGMPDGYVQPQSGYEQGEYEQQDYETPQQAQLDAVEGYNMETTHDTNQVPVESNQHPVLTQ